MSEFIAGESRSQATMFPERLDDYIAEDNAVRVVDVFIDGINLSSMGFQAIPAATGRPAYHPATMLKLYVYGYLNRVQSSRRLEREADEATNSTPAYYMINCAHPSHFDDVLDASEPWVKRVHGLRANASNKSHAELDEAEELDDGNPDELGHQYKQLKSILSNLNVLGGCCGTDHRHIEKICTACSH